MNYLNRRMGFLGRLAGWILTLIVTLQPSHVEVQAQDPEYSMPWLGRIKPNMHDGGPAWLPKYKDGRDWLFMPVWVDGQLRLRVFRFETLADTVYDDFGPLIDDSVRLTTFLGRHVKYGDFNGDGRLDYIGGNRFWLMSNDTGHTLQAMPLNGGPVDGAAVDFDGDGYDDIMGGGKIRWGDSASPLTTFSTVAFESFNGPGRPSYGFMGWAGGKPFALSQTNGQMLNCEMDTTRQFTFEFTRFARLQESNILAHDTIIGIDTTFDVRDVNSFTFMFCVDDCPGCRFMPTVNVGSRWTITRHYYMRNGLFVMEYYGSERTIINDTGVVRNVANYTGGPVGSFIDFLGDFAVYSRGRRLDIMHFADSADTFLTALAVVKIPDSLDIDVIDVSYPHTKSILFPDITGDGKAEIGFLYRHRKQGVIIDVFDAFGALPTSGGGDPIVAGSDLSLSLGNQRARWTGGTASSYDIRIYDVEGRLLRTATVAGHDLGTTGIDLKGLRGNVFIIVDGGSNAKHTFPVNVESK